jgi:deoxyribodipyrimidine photo-lyase
MIQDIKIIWFRRDLRIEDNKALFDGLKSPSIILPIFILDDYFANTWEDRSPIRSSFLAQSIINLRQNFYDFGVNFHILQGNSEAVIKNLMFELAKNNFRPKLYFNEDVQIEYGLIRDQNITNFCATNSFEINKYRPSFLESKLLDSPEIKNFVTEYNNYLYSNLDTPNLKNTLKLPENILQILDKYGVNEEKLSSNASSELFITGGIDHYNQKFSSFLTNRYQNYHYRLSYPYLSQKGATSHISPYLTFGTATTKSVFQKTNQLIQNIKQNPQKHHPKAAFSLKSFIDRIKWRDRFTSKLWKHPEMAHTNRHQEFDEVYNKNELSSEKMEYLQKWKNGQTGFALVDASMRELKTHGWMNFRLRAMNATFLCINCGISWQYGAEHFMNYLIDGDVAIDSWQWQMQAGVTNPLSDTFRIYNPDKNLIEKDKDLQYVHHWLPEAEHLKLDELVNNESANSLFTTNSYYPKMLDFEKTRQKNGKIISEIRKRVRNRINEKLSQNEDI